MASDVAAIRAIASQSPEAAQWSEQHYDEMAAPASERLVLVAKIAAERPTRGGSGSRPGIPDSDATGENAAPAIVGFLVAREIAGEWELENVAVAAHARRRGIGRELVRELVKTAVQRGSQAIHLEVRGKNRAARALYERLGFVRSGLRRGYYECPKDDAILYTLKFRAATLEIG